MNHVAIDVHDEYSQICVMSPNRELLLEAKVATTREAFSEFFRGRAASRVVYEAGPHSLWISELLRELGHEPMACHARRLRLIAESRNKNDRVDAGFMARLSISDLDLMQPIAQRSRETLDERSVTTVRAALVETRKQLRTTVRGLVKPFGVRLAQGKKAALVEASTAALPPHVRGSIDALLEVLNTVGLKIKELDKAVDQFADRPETRRMQTIPGVGPLIAVAFKHTLEDPSRFRPDGVGAYVGLTPSNRVSAWKKLSPIDRNRPGDPYVRSLLIQAAWSMINSRSESDLAVWGRKKIQEIGSKKAPVALGRKIAVLMHHLWLHDQVFMPHPPRKRKAAA